ncbi:hypothetical protein KFK09_023448 [Dendrobium nobile]|uniref:Uncharacterized protein n=1 Tax=Dendrobium nobile TaxID=94219 RepID=A0A8T3ALX6_DENNO|nr:hypothetical protein KFK09_023448 [Dendrobium nobile]
MASLKSLHVLTGSHLSMYLNQAKAAPSKHMLAAINLSSSIRPFTAKYLSTLWIHSSTFPSSKTGIFSFLALVSIPYALFPPWPPLSQAMGSSQVPLSPYRGSSSLLGRR